MRMVKLHQVAKSLADCPTGHAACVKNHALTSGFGASIICKTFSSGKMIAHRYLWHIQCKRVAKTFRQRMPRACVRRF